MNRFHGENHHSFVEQLQFYVNVPGLRIKLSSLISPYHAERVTRKQLNYTHRHRTATSMHHTWNTMKKTCPGCMYCHLLWCFWSLWFSSCCTLIVYTVDKGLLVFQNNWICIFSFARSYTTMKLQFFIASFQSHCGVWGTVLPNLTGIRNKEKKKSPPWFGPLTYQATIKICGIPPICITLLRFTFSQFSPLYNSRLILNSPSFCAPSILNHTV